MVGTLGIGVGIAVIGQHPIILKGKPSPPRVNFATNVWAKIGMGIAENNTIPVVFHDGTVKNVPRSSLLYILILHNAC
jgi:hypothetical protein